MNYEAQQVEVEVKGRKVKTWAVVDGAGVVKRAYTSKMIGDPQGGAEAYADELNAMLPAPPKQVFVEPGYGESFSHVEPHHCPPGFYPPAAFLLALNFVNLFDSNGECKGCGQACYAGSDQKEHFEKHRREVRELRAAGRAKAEPTKRDWSDVAEGDPFVIATDMREGGASYREISEEFARRGIKTARGKDEWSTTAVMRLLKG